MLKGVALCNPYAQGGLDGLCGLYAAINAIGLVAAPIRPLNTARTATLFECGAEWLHARGTLLAAVTDGIDEDEHYAMTQRVAQEAEQMIGTPVSVTRPISPNESFHRPRLLAAIDTGLEQGAATILSLEVTYSHYTVVAGRTDTRYYMHDSDEMKWIERKSLGVLAEGSAKRHQVSRNGIVRVGI
jgi:hypothetical protein